MKLFEKLPEPGELKRQAEGKEIKSRKVNGHFHTPYSFSAFNELEDVFNIAEDEQVDVLGINDFYTTAGYDEFAEMCMKYEKFPLFNIEFMGLLKNEQEQGFRVNDPNNPGRTYFSGKGLDYPVTLSGDLLEKLQRVRNESENQTKEMVDKAATHLRSVNNMFELSYDDILKKYTKGMVRERHIAKAIRNLIWKQQDDFKNRQEALKQVYGGNDSKANINDPAAIDGEIRSQLLKSGGVAYVKEDPRAFLEISEIIDIILGAGGIPCYPVLLDDNEGNFTEYEEDKQTLYDKLTAMNVYSLEIIPGRNKYVHLKPFVEFFYEKGFVITFGTEHNTPVLDPLTVSVGDGALDDYLMKVNYEGACIIAAHQYLRAKGEPGYLDGNGKPARDRKELSELGNAVIDAFINLNNN